MVAGIRGHGGTSLIGPAVILQPNSEFQASAVSQWHPAFFESDFQEGMNSEPGQPNQSSHGGGLEQFITGRAEEL